MSRRTTNSEIIHSRKYSESGLSAGVSPLSRHYIERKPSKAQELIMDSFFFLLGGIILCSLLYGVIFLT